MRLDVHVHEKICERGEIIDDAASISVDLLICTLIFENQGLEKSRSASNLRKISGPANLDFFSRSPLRK